MVFEGKRSEDLILFFCTLVAVFGAWMLARHGAIYLSPDETANTVFAESFADQSTLFLYEPLDPLLENSLFPRSSIAAGGRIVPVGFVGLPALYGMIVSVVGGGVLPFLTATIALIAIFLWREIVAKIFGRDIGWWAAILLALHPAWIYYASRGLLPNVLFVSLLIISVFLLIVRPFHNVKKISIPFDVLLAGTALGLAMAVRTAEALWIGVALVVGFAVFWKQMGWKKLGFFIIGMVIAFAPIASFNTSLYGAPWKTGYTFDAHDKRVEMLASAPGVAPPSFRDKTESVLRPIFPFGIHPRAVWRNVRDNGVVLYWWFAVLSLGGCVLMFIKRPPFQGGLQGVTEETVTTPSPSLKRRGTRLFIFIFILVAGWLAVLYGSWTFFDNPDPTFLTIGNSYSRYWLPAFVLATVFAALSCVWLESRFPRFRLAVRGVLFVVIVAFGIQTAFFFPQDGLFAASAVLERSVEIREDLLGRIEPNAIVITDHGDKLLFPFRRVRVPLRNDTTFRLMPSYLAQVPLYYYGITLPDEDFQFLNENRLAVLGLRIELVKTYDAESLYRIVKN